MRLRRGQRVRPFVGNEPKEDKGTGTKGSGTKGGAEKTNMVLVVYTSSIRENSWSTQEGGWGAEQHSLCKRDNSSIQEGFGEGVGSLSQKTPAFLVGVPRAQE